MVIPENLSQGGIRDRHHRLCGVENTEREKLSGRQKSTGEIPSRRGEIVAIVITIALDFVGVLDTRVSRSTCSWAPSTAQLRPRGETATEAQRRRPS
jgi:hypothetical protein